MGIPVGMDYTVRLMRFGEKRVCCEVCGEEYRYIVMRQAKGHGFSPLFLANQSAQGHAEEKAWESAGRKISVAVEPTPCPECGWFQKDMVAEAYSRRFQSLWYAGLVLIVFGFAASFPPLAMRFLVGDRLWPWWPGVVSACFGLILWIIRTYRRVGYDVNEDLDAHDYWQRRCEETRRLKAEWDSRSN